MMCPDVEDLRREWLRRLNANLLADGRGEPIPYPELLLDDDDAESEAQTA